MATRLDTVPNFKEVKLVAAPAAESIVLSAANFPLANGFDARRASEIAFYWLATGENPVHVVTLDALVLDGGLTPQSWVTGGRVIDLGPGIVARVTVHGSSLATFRIHDLTMPGATDFKVRAALIPANRQ